jgi:hypothetical protein
LASWRIAAWREWLVKKTVDIITDGSLNDTRTFAHDSRLRALDEDLNFMERDEHFAGGFEEADLSPLETVLLGTDALLY